MVQGLKIQVCVKIDLISAPGTLISENHGDVYISVRLFNTNFRSIDFYPYFPIVVRSEFECSKLVPFISDPGRLAKNLESETVKIELYQGNEKIAYYHCNARKFLFPKSPVKTYSESDREILLRCTPKYEGVLQPKFEFGTRVVIEETYIKPRLSHRLAQSEVLTTIDERLRRKPEQIRKEPPTTNTSNIQAIKYSQTYLDLHKRIGRALVVNKEDKFQMELPERKKDPIVYLSEKSDWSQHASKFRGDGCFRDTFDSAISDIYEDILTQHQKHLD